MDLKKLSLLLLIIIFSMQNCKENINKPIINKKIESIIVSWPPRYRIQLESPSQNDTIRWTNTVELKWDAIDNYNFEVNISKDDSLDDPFYTRITNEKKITTEELEKGYYYWQVVVKPDTSDKKYKSDIYGFAIDGPKPPTILSHKTEEIKVYEKENQFTWNKPEYANQYQIQLIDYYSKNIISEKTLNDTTIIKDLDLYVYNVKVRASNTVNIWGEWSSQIIVSNGLYSKRIKLNDNEMLAGCVQISNFGIIVAGYSNVNRETFLFSIDPIGNVKYHKWIQNFMVKNIANTLDNNIILIGKDQNHNSKIVKLDINLNEIWSYEPDNNTRKFITSLLPLNNGNYYITGQFNRRIYLLQLSNSGQLLFEKIIGDSLSAGYKIKEINNHYLIMATQFNPTIGSEAVYNLIISLNGDILSEYKFLEFSGFPNQNYNLRNGIVVSNDIYCVGNFGFAYGSFVHKSDIFGKEYWLKELISQSPSDALICISTEDNNLLIGGYEHSIFLFKIDMNGNIIWRNDYKGTSCLDIIQTEDKGFLLLGFSHEFAGGIENYIHLIKINKDGLTYDKL